MTDREVLALNKVAVSGNNVIKSISYSAGIMATGPEERGGWTSIESGRDGLCDLAGMDIALYNPVEGMDDGSGGKIAPAERYALAAVVDDVAYVLCEDVSSGRLRVLRLESGDKLERRYEVAADLMFVYELCASDRAVPPKVLLVGVSQTKDVPDKSTGRTLSRITERTFAASVRDAMEIGDGLYRVTDVSDDRVTVECVLRGEQKHKFVLSAGENERLAVDDGDGYTYYDVRVFRDCITR